MSTISFGQRVRTIKQKGKIHATIDYQAECLRLQVVSFPSICSLFPLKDSHFSSPLSSWFPHMCTCVHFLRLTL